MHPGGRRGRGKSNLEAAAAPAALELYERAREHQERGEALAALGLYTRAAKAFKREGKGSTSKEQRLAKRKAMIGSGSPGSSWVATPRSTG